MLRNTPVPSREIKSHIYVHARQTRLLLWDDVSRQGCEQIDGQLALRSDGTGTWSCTTISRNRADADVWHADFVLRDACGAAVYGLGPFYSPLMEGSASARQRSWSASFTFPAELFSSIHSAMQNCGCLPPVYALRQATPSPATPDLGWCRAGMISGMGGAYA